MPNMSYCRFQNTLYDLQDCKDHILEHLSTVEHSARRRLIEICQKIAEEDPDMENPPAPAHNKKLAFEYLEEAPFVTDWSFNLKENVFEITLNENEVPYFWERWLVQNVIRFD